MEQVILQKSSISGFIWVSVLRGNSLEGIEKPILEDVLSDVLKELGADNLPQTWIDGASQYPPFFSKETQETEPLVYFIEGGGMIKIGVADYPDARLAEISTMSPVPLTILATIKGGYRVETELHVKFATSRSHGEWFHKTPELLNYINAIMGERNE